MRARIISSLVLYRYDILVPDYMFMLSSALVLGAWLTMRRCSRYGVPEEAAYQAVFYALTMLGLVMLRRQRPEMERPYRAAGYPYLTVLYIVFATAVMACLLIYKPSFSFRGLLIVLTGVPVYYLWRSKE